jgi:guanylate kinase
MSNNRGTLFVISGPSGAGKGTVLKKLFKTAKNLYYSVSATTRLPREGEMDGINYFFYSKDEFEKLISENKLLEYTSFCDNYYGTPTEPVDEMLNNGYDVILEIEVHGANQVKKKRADCVLVFILPPSVEELSQRLRGRHTESEDKIMQRLKEANYEMQQTAKYDYVIINDKVTKAANELYNIIQNTRTK